MKLLKTNFQIFIIILLFSQLFAVSEPKIKVFKKFSDSIKDFNYVIATSNRVRSQKKKEISFKKLKEIISKNYKVAIVFGPEKSGLDNEDLSLCDYTIKINSNQKFSSLNLSHAVAIVCYNLFTLLLKKSDSNKEKLIENVAKKNELLSFYKLSPADDGIFFLIKSAFKTGALETGGCRRLIHNRNKQKT